MVNKDFYNSKSYRNKQSKITKLNWQKGRMDFLRKSVVRHCIRHGCTNTFSVIPSDPKNYCSQSCSATVNNSKRRLSLDTRIKISHALTGKKYPDRPKMPPQRGVCLYCHKDFTVKFWRPTTDPQKYCSIRCAMKDIGGRPTSPRAARAKAGIRSELSKTIYFYSRWEANFARLMNFLKVKWVHQPKTFQLESQKYTPDFYLPEHDIYIEIKNFLSDYSKNRDIQFRKLYPKEKLMLILKDDYLDLQNKYSGKIKGWEYNNSPIEIHLSNN